MDDQTGATIMGKVGIIDLTLALLLYLFMSYEIILSSFFCKTCHQIEAGAPIMAWYP